MKKEASAAAVGNGFYDRIMPSKTGKRPCLRCGEHTALIGQGGECLRYLLERRRHAREAVTEASGPF